MIAGAQEHLRWENNPQIKDFEDFLGEAGTRKLTIINFFDKEF